MNQLIGQFIYLQVLDGLSTLAFLGVGVEEANPVVRMLLAVAPSPIVALAIAKMAGVLLATYCWRTGRLKLLSRANVFFAALVVWNLVAFVGQSTLS